MADVFAISTDRSHAIMADGKIVKASSWVDRSGNVCDRDDEFVRFMICEWRGRWVVIDTDHFTGKPN